MLPLWLERSRKGALLATALFFSAGYTAIGLTLVLLVVIPEGIVTRRLPWHRSEGDVYLASFITVFLISGWVSPYRPIAVGSTGLAALTIFLAFGTLYRQLHDDPGFLKPFLWAWVIGGVVAAVWAFYLHQVTGRPAFTPEHSQNALGTALLIPLLLGLGLALRSQTVWGYLMAAGCDVLILGLAFTTSRGAWLGTAFGMVSFFWLTRLRYSWREVAVLVCVGLVAVILIGLDRGSPALVQRASSIVEPEHNIGLKDRIVFAKTARAIFEDYPVMGTGLNTFSLVYPKYQLPEDTSGPTQPYAHNVFLNMAAEGGILGLAAFTATMLWAWVMGRRWYAASTSRSEAMLSAIVLSAFLGTLVHQLVDSTMISVHVGSGVWFLVAIMAASRHTRQPPAVLS